MKRVTTRIAGAVGAIAVLAALGYTGTQISKNVIETSQFNEARNNLAQRCVDGNIGCEGCDNLATINTMHDIFNQQVKDDGGNRVLKNVSGDPFKEVCKNMIR